MWRTGGASGGIWRRSDAGLAAKLLEDLIKVCRPAHDPGRRRSLAQHAENAWPHPLAESPDDLDQLWNDQKFRTVFRQPGAAAEEVSPVPPCAPEVRCSPTDIEEYDQIGGFQHCPGHAFDYPGLRRDQRGLGGSAFIGLCFPPSGPPDDLIEALHWNAKGGSDATRQGRLSAAGVSRDEDPRHGERLSRVPVSRRWAVDGPWVKGATFQSNRETLPWPTNSSRSTARGRSPSSR